MCRLRVCVVCVSEWAECIGKNGVCTRMSGGFLFWRYFVYASSMCPRLPIRHSRPWQPHPLPLLFRTTPLPLLSLACLRIRLRHGPTATQASSRLNQHIFHFQTAEQEERLKDESGDGRSVRTWRLKSGWQNTGRGRLGAHHAVGAFTRVLGIGVFFPCSAPLSMYLPSRRACTIPHPLRGTQQSQYMYIDKEISDASGSYLVRAL